MKALGALLASFLVILVVVVVGVASGAGERDPMPVDCAPTGLAIGQIPNGWAVDIKTAAGLSGVPAAVLAAQLNAESSWNPKAVSVVGAQGLGQFMPGTWATWGNGGDPFDPKAAIAAQGRFMGALVQQLAPLSKSSGTDSVSLALAGYNAGAGAVEMFGGIPPYGETQDYVAKIMESAKTYGDSTAPADISCGGGTSGGEGDDLPWKTAPTWVQVGTENAGSPLGMLNRECVDFALWRVNQEMGSSKAPFKFLNGTFNTDGSVLGSAVFWRAAWYKKGWTVSQKPQVGAVTWYDAGAPGGDPQWGHVGVVKAINADGTIVEEGYNMLPDHDHAYYTRTIAADYPTAYLYVPGGK